jgi:AraC family transcriptional regulator
VTGSVRVEYEKRVNRVIDHIGRHLSEELSLSSLAAVAAFSPFHFHRVFKATTGETLFGFIQRLRIERAAIALTAHREQSILEVALDHGFSSAATFARAFRAHFGMSATAWRGGGAARWSARHRPGRNPRKQVRKRGKARHARRPDTPRNRTEEGDMSVQVRELPPYHVAYMRYVGPYGPRGIPELWEKLQKWMEARGLATEAAVKLGVGHDDPHITEAAKCRYDACVVVPQDFPSNKWINMVDLPGGKVAVSEFTGGAHEIGEAWERVFSAWLPGSGYQPDDRSCVEVYRGHAGVDGKPGVFRGELCLPVRPL